MHLIKLLEELFVLIELQESNKLVHSEEGGVTNSRSSNNSSKLLRQVFLDKVKEKDKENLKLPEFMMANLLDLVLLLAEVRRWER